MMDIPPRNASQPIGIPIPQRRNTSASRPIDLPSNSLQNRPIEQFTPPHLLVEQDYSDFSVMEKRRRKRAISFV